MLLRSSFRAFSLGSVSLSSTQGRGRPYPHPCLTDEDTGLGTTVTLSGPTAELLQNTPLLCDAGPPRTSRAFSRVDRGVHGLCVPGARLLTSIWGKGRGDTQQLAASGVTRRVFPELSRGKHACSLVGARLLELKFPKAVRIPATSAEEIATVCGRRAATANYPI